MSVCSDERRRHGRFRRSLSLPETRLIRSVRPDAMIGLRGAAVACARADNNAAASLCCWRNACEMSVALVTGLGRTRVCARNQAAKFDGPIHVPSMTTTYYVVWTAATNLGGGGDGRFRTSKGPRILVQWDRIRTKVGVET